MVLKSVISKQITTRFRKLLLGKNYEKAKKIYEKHFEELPFLKELWVQEYRKNINERCFFVALSIASVFENTREWIVPAATNLVSEALCAGKYKEAKKWLGQYPVQYFSILDILQGIRYQSASDILVVLEAFEPNPRRDINAVMQTMETALAVLQDSKYRQGFLLELPQDIELMITGDLHGNRHNLDIIIQKAELAKNSNRHLIFQEIIHCRSFLIDRRDVSFLEVIDILELLIQFPDQVHLLLGNHDLNFLLNRSSMRSNRKLDDYFFRGLDIIFGKEVDEVIQKYKEIIAWMAAAIKCGPLIMTHSNPESKRLKQFDISRLKKISTLKPNKSIDFLVSGRDHSYQTVKEFLEMCGSDFSVIGHEFCRKGHEIPNAQQVIIDSCHNLGSYILCKPSKINSIDNLEKCIHPIRS